MDCLEGPVEGSGGIVAVPQSHIQHLVPLPQVCRCMGHSAAADILLQGYTGQVGEHPLKVVGRTAGQPAQFLQADLTIQILFQMIQRFVPALQPIHNIHSLRSSIPLFPCSVLAFQVQKMRGVSK